MRITQLSMALALAITASSVAQAQVFSEVVSFGDSLTDAGNTASVDGNPYTLPGNSWTTNPDSVHSQYLSELLGLGFQNYSNAGGSNYAYAGACAMANGSATPPVPFAFNCYLPFPSVTNQVSGYIAANGGQVDPSKVYTLWAGANDILTGAGISAGVAQAYAQYSAATTVGLAGALLNAGAKTVVLFNLPDLGKTPRNLAAGAAASAGASGLTAIYNNQFNNSVAALPDGIVAINTYALINEVIANPSAYGYTNVTGEACTTGTNFGPPPAVAGACGPNGGGEPYTYATGTNKTYLFADGIHPTGSAHEMLANVVYATLSAPGLVSLAPEVALQANFANNTALEDSINNESAAGSEVGKVIGYASIQFTDQNLDGTGYTPSLSGDMTALNVGASYRMNEYLSFALGATIGDPSGSTNSGGELDGNAIVFGGVLQLEKNGLYGRATLDIGSTDMDISRNINLNGFVRKEQGNTSVDQTSAIFELGYQFKSESYRHGPYFGIDLNYTTTNAFTEDGSSSTAMRFEEFDADTNDAYIGYRFSGVFGNFRPFADVAWVSPNNQDQTFVTAGTASLPGSFTLGGYTPGEDSFIDYNIGAAMTFAEVWDGYLSFRGQTSDGVQDGYVISLGVRRTF